MVSDRPLMYSVNVYYGCCKIIENFLARAYYYCLCNFYQVCPTKRDCLAGARDYCCICRVLNHYSIEELNVVKKDIFKLTKLYFDLLDDVHEIKKTSLILISGTTRLSSYMRDSIEFLYNL